MMKTYKPMIDLPADFAAEIEALEARRPEVERRCAEIRAAGERRGQIRAKTRRDRDFLARKEALRRAKKCTG